MKKWCVEMQAAAEAARRRQKHERTIAEKQAVLNEKPSASDDDVVKQSTANQHLRMLNGTMSAGACLQGYQ